MLLNLEIKGLFITREVLISFFLTNSSAKVVNFSTDHITTFLGAFAKLRNAAIKFVMFVRSSAWNGSFVAHWSYCHEIWYRNIFRKSVEKIQVFSSRTRITANLHEDSYTCTWRQLYIYMKTAVHLHEDSYTFTWRQLYIYTKTAIHLHEDNYTFMIISCSFVPRIRNVLDKWCRENQNPHFVFSNCFSENLAVYENVENYGRAKQATEYNIIRRKCIPKATNTHSGISSTHSFSITTVVARKRLNVM